MQFQGHARGPVQAHSRNELVIRIQPDEAVYLKMNAQEAWSRDRPPSPPTWI